jgi:pimeloyl-ACP methyl ester carboxylesterase
VTRLVEQLDPVAAAPAVRAPALLVYGGRDRIAPPDDGRALQRALPAARLELVRGATHFSTLFERGVEALIADFVDAHTPREGGDARHTQGLMGGGQ